MFSFLLLLRANNFSGHYYAKQKKQICITLKEVEKLCFFESLVIFLLKPSVLVLSALPKGALLAEPDNTNCLRKTIIFCSSNADPPQSP